jgi:cytochrome c
VGLADGNVVVADTVAACHGEVGKGREDGDQSGNDVVETLAL